jgi:hypothetical protein
MVWQPISTAPQHDADILLCHSYVLNGKKVWYYGIGFWWEYDKEWRFMGDDNETVPEAWCPITPPEQAP